MKTTRIIGLIVLFAACQNARVDDNSGSSDEAKFKPETEETEPMSYDDLKQNFKDSSGAIDDLRKTQIFLSVLPFKKNVKYLDYSGLDASNIKEAYLNFSQLTKHYKDSAVQYLDVLEDIFSGLEHQFEKLNETKPIDLTIKLEISSIKSQIHTNLSELRLKKIEK